MQRTARRMMVGAAIAGVVVIAAARFLILEVFGGSEPAPVALSSLSPSSAATASGGGSFAGAWTVDATSGSLDAGTSSFAGYRVQEELSGLGSNTAVGRTQDVSGTMTIDGTSIAELSIRVDMTTLRSDDDRRDNSIHGRGLQTDAFPTATFTLTQPIDVGTKPKEGERIQLTATGDLTLHGVTKSVQVPIEARWTGSTIEATASFDVALADYGIDPPVGFLVLSIQDHGTIEMHLLLQKS
jgi:polyisoprenoid-binding protein YceI